MLLEGDIAATDLITKDLKTIFNDDVTESKNNVLFVLVDWLLLMSSNPKSKTSPNPDEHHQIVRKIAIRLIEKQQSPSKLKDLVKDILGQRFRSINLLASIGHQLSDSQFHRLFKVATTHNNIPLCKYLV